MEAYCEANTGTFCFNRPIYDDQMARPAFQLLIRAEAFKVSTAPIS
jgi:hypothetical protein